MVPRYVLVDTSIEILFACAIDGGMRLRAALLASVFTFALLVGFPGHSGFGLRVADAHTFVEVSVDYLAKTATRVIVGVPGESDSVWEETESGRRIVTYHRVRVHMDVVGGGSREILVRRLGGVVDGIGQIVHGSPPIRENVPVLLFLTERKDSTFSVLAMEQGCFPVSISKDRRIRVEPRRLDRTPLPDKQVRAEGRPLPASILEGLSIEQAKQVILEERSKNAQ